MRRGIRRGRARWYARVNGGSRRTLPETVERAEIGGYRHDGHEQGKENEFVEDGAVVVSRVATACTYTHGCTPSCGAMAVLPVDTPLDIVCGVVYNSNVETSSCGGGGCVVTKITTSSPAFTLSSHLTTHRAMATELRRIALADPHTLSPPRFLVGGQLSHTVSGDVKLYEWDRDVSHPCRLRPTR